MGRKALGIRTCTCRVCGKEFQYDRSKRNGQTATRCGKCGVQKFRKNQKLKSVEYKGGKCAICGYNKSVEALDFHHIDPTQKSFGLGGTTKAWHIVQAELDKTILLCANCHREVEAGITKL